jgi:hypothetical protein
MRKRFGLLVGIEEHDGEDLTVDGGWCLRDLQWTAKEVAMMGIPWAKQQQGQADCLGVRNCQMAVRASG